MALKCSHASRSPYRSRSRSRSRGISPTGTRVHVTNLGLEPSKSKLMEVFEKFGKVVDVWLARTPPSFAFIVYDSMEHAEQAVRHMDGRVVNGNRVQVSLALPRTRGKRSGAFNPYLRCYQCGRKGHLSRQCQEIPGANFPVSESEQLCLRCIP